ncbi:hypothetical protein GGD81_001992 [Rhodobium orientis]|uniref:BA14K family protein n=1 Tax=Rhodobium orientis TaxID=34017 RepID=A0A327JUU3_9HYPH|nr:hypothetical protein [Rhodobium orientis]MBB4302954.1 hypothetical protein [Rhodobium orientis]MBK5949515.1 hypothetical protein [Rhodobium orientis]RAI29306.1 hypothetical protein CH339_03200 [Rhodobium orientis]
MKRAFLSGLALAALLATFHGPANAHPITPPATAYLAHADTAEVVKVGWRAKRRHTKRFRYNRRNRGHGYGRFRGGRRASRLGPYVHPGVASMLIRRRQCLDALFPASDPACR